MSSLKINSKLNFLLISSSNNEKNIHSKVATYQMKRETHIIVGNSPVTNPIEEKDTPQLNKKAKQPPHPHP